MKRFLCILLMMIILACYGAATAFAADGTDTSDVSESPQPAHIYIDNENTYDNIKSSYSNGYVPTVRSGVAKIVLPIICEGELVDNKIRATVNLGNTANMPFVSKNYEKTVRLAKHKINGKDSISAYLITFDLALSDDRTNGVYPVILNLSATDITGNPLNEQVTLYVTITNGRAPQEHEENKIPPVLTPKILVEACKAVAIDETGAELAVDRITAGQRMRLTVTLRNMSKNVGVLNMTVNVAAPNGYFSLCNNSRDVYIEAIAADSCCDVVYEYTTSVLAPAGEYSFTVTYDFSYMQGENYLTSSGSGTATVRLHQDVKVQFDKVMLPTELVVTDTINTTVSAINLGRCTVYNVRAVIEADGLSPAGTAFIGNIDAGQSANATIQIYVSSLTQSETKYGYTSGKVTFYYEDADGKEYKEESKISTTVKSPFIAAEYAAKDSPNQWWIIIGITAVAILICVAWLMISYTRKRKKYGKD